MRILVIGAVAVILVLPHNGVAQRAVEDYHARVDRLVESWVELFGEELIFTGPERHGLFNSMVAVGCKPLAEFNDVPVGARRADWLKASTDRWMLAFFTESFRPRVEPEKYYLQSAAEKSVLFYRWQTDKYALRMFESVAGVLIEVTTKDGKAIRPQPDEFSELLKALLNVEPGLDELAEQFGVDRQIGDGDVLTNAANLARVDYHDWRETIIVFGSKRGLCILLLKADPGRASVTLPKNPNWLKDGLLFPGNELPRTRP